MAGRLGARPGRLPPAIGFISTTSPAITTSAPARLICTRVHPPTPPTLMSESHNWQGWLRPDGRKGVRNLVLVIYTVECAQFVAHAIAQGEEDVHTIGFSGCYDNAFAIRLMLALARHPNVGAVLTVGLGCEYPQAARLAESVKKSGRLSESFLIQDIG